MKEYIQITNASHLRYKQYFSLKGMDNRHFQKFVNFMIKDFKKRPFSEIKEARQNLAYVLDEDRFWTPNIEEATNDGAMYLDVLWFDNDSRNLKNLGEKKPEPIKYNCTPPEPSTINRGSGSRSLGSSWNGERYVDVAK